jgi:tRNA pseudouridine38-40 synthase
MYSRNCEIREGICFPDGMHRIALGVEYSGATFQGFQKQASTENTVQAHLERALSDIAQEPITLVCAGRTDAGVHATGQVVHFDTLAERPDKAWVLGANTKMPDEIRIHWAKPVASSFHARFSAASRTYRYLFFNGKVRPATLGKAVSVFSQPLDFDRMAQASTVLLGEHDFSSFRSSQCQARNPVRCIESIRWFQHAQLWVMEIKANAFLHHMVRNIVGSLVEVGKGQKDIAWMERVLAARDRCEAGPTAAPWGLYLVDVGYPNNFELPRHAPGPFFLAN